MSRLLSRLRSRGRVTVRWLTAAAAVLLVAALVWGFLLRNETGAALAGPQVLALLGLTTTALALLVVRVVESEPGDLVVPERFGPQLAAYGGLPTPSWWAPFGAAAFAVLVVGLLVDRYTAGLGAGLFAVAVVRGVLDGLRRQASDRRRAPGGPAPLDRGSVRAARRIRSFALAHPGPDGATAVEAVVEHTGRYGARLALVGSDGRWGDQLIADAPRAELAAELAGVTVTDGFSRELTARMHNTSYDWSRMGGGRTHLAGPETPTPRRLDEGTTTVPVDGLPVEGRQ